MFYKKAKRFLAGLCAWSLILTSVDQGAMVVMAAEESTQAVETVAEETGAVSQEAISVVGSDGSIVTVSASDVDVEVEVPVNDMDDGADVPSGVDVSGGSTDVSGSNLMSAEDTTAPEGYVYVADKDIFWNATDKIILFPATKERIGDESYLYNPESSNTYAEEVREIRFQEGAVIHAIGNRAFKNCPNLQKIDLSNCSILADIYEEAFSGCSALSEIIFANEFQSIGKKSFYNCDSLTSVTLTPGLTDIGENAFQGCDNLATVVVQANNISTVGNGVFKECAISTITFGGSNTLVPANLFKNATFAENANIVIPNYIQEIDQGAFQGSNIANITLEATNSALVTIDSGAFTNCTSLTGITFPNTLTTIGASAFSGCTEIKTLVLPDSVQEIGNSAFNGCIKMESLTLSKAANTLGTGIFQKCEALTSVTIPEGMTTIAASQFKECTSLGSIEIASTVTTIGSSAFEKCEVLNGVQIPDTVASIGASAFADCVGLQIIMMPKGLTQYSSSLFKGCQSLCALVTSETDLDNEVTVGELVIPNAVETIGGSAFAGCLNISTVVISENVTSIGGNAFDGCTALRNLTIDSTKITSGGTYAFRGAYLTNITLPEGITSIPKNMFHYAGFSANKTFAIPATVTSIGDSAFTGTNIVGVSFAEGNQLESIGASAFQSCTAITQFQIPETVTKISDSAFSGCTALTSITIPDNVTYLGASAFKGCEVLTTINYNAKEVTSDKLDVFNGCNVHTVTIGDEVRVIPAYFLKGIMASTDQSTSQEVDIKVNIPASVIKIGKQAFYGISNLIEVSFAEDATLSEIGESAFEGCTTLATCQLPESVDIIGASAFKGCIALTVMDMPVSMKTIGANAFNSCSCLTKVSMNSLISTIGDGAFTGCTNAKFHVVKGSYAEQWLIANGFESQIVYVNSITYELNGGVNDERNIGGYETGDVFTFYPAVKPGYIFEGWYLEDTYTTQVVDLTGREGDLTLYAKYIYGVGEDENYVSYADGQFKFNADNGVLIVSASVENVQASIFEDAAAVAAGVKDKTKYIVFETDSAAKFIYENCFKGWKVLTSVDFTNCPALTTIDDNAFNGCITLNSVTFSAHLNVIGASAFAGCTSLKDITLTEKLTSIGGNAFKGCSALEKVVINATNLTCGDSIFTNCKIKEIKFATNLVMVPAKLFKGATFASDANIVIPYYINEIGESAFSGCTSLESIIFEDTEANPSTLSTISANAFNGCSKLATVTIPASVNKIQANAFYNCKAMTEVVIPNGITDLGDSAFANCSGLVSIQLPSAITNLGKAIFQNCTALGTVVIPDGFKAVSESMFAGCTALKTVTIASTVESIGGSAFSGCTALEEIVIPGSVKTVGGSAFKGCSELKSVEVADGVETLGNSVFENCKALTSVTIADSVTAIGASAFAGCKLLNNPVLPKGLTVISSKLFQNCNNLQIISTSDRTAEAGQNLVLPATVTEIGASAFENCIAIKGAVIPANVTTIGEAVFSGCPIFSSVEIESLVLEKCGKKIFAGCMLDKVVFPEGITAIPANLFCQAGFTTNTTVTIPATVTTIGQYAFAGTTGEGNGNRVAKIDFEEGSKLTTIENNAFQYCVAITEFEIPATVTTIGSYAFENCQKLNGITIPENVTSLGMGAFQNCSVLTTIHFNAIAVTTTNKNIFKGCNIHTILIGDKVTILPANLFVGANFADVSSGSDVQLIKLRIPVGVVEIGDFALANVKNISEVIFDEGSMLKTIGAGVFQNCIELTACELPDTVETIGKEAFSGCVKLAAMKLPAALTSMGNGAFKNCSLVTEYTVPTGVRKIEDNTFEGNTALTKITFAEAETVEDVITTIGVSAFAGCTKLTEIVIPEGVTTIGASAFSGDSALVKVVIPASVTTIGTDAFKGCTQAKFYVVKDSDAETWLKNNGFTSQIAYQNKITYVLNDGVNDVRNRSGYLDGDAFTFFPATKPGYAFEGWYLDADFKTEIKDLTGCSGDITLYANWGGQLEYKITYELDGGENHEDNPATYTYDEKLSISLKNPTKYGYDFKGWYTDNQFTAKSRVSSIARKTCLDYVLYAKWEPKTVTVTLGFDSKAKDAVFVDENGKESKSKSVKVTFGQPYGELPVPVREKYLFDGWYTDNGDLITDATVVAIAESHKLIARWVVDARVVAPKADPVSGSVVDKGTKVILTTETLGADIYYNLVTYTTDGEDATTDGADAITCADPTTGSIRYTEPITINENTIIKAIGVKENFKSSAVAEFKYKVVKESSYWGDVAVEDRGKFKDASEVPEGLWVAGIEDREYTGSAITFDIRVYDHKTLLKLKTDYTVKYSSNKTVPKPGGKMPTVTITGKGNYKGKYPVTFNILPVDINDENVVADDMWVAVKPGKFQKPVPTITWGKFKLKNKKDFIVSYESYMGYSTEGEYTIEITGQGNYTGTRTIKCNLTTANLISKVKVSGYAKSVIFDGKPVTQSIIVKNGSAFLSEGTDYEVEYLDNDKIGTATIKITGKGSYVGTKRVTFKINPIATLNKVKFNFNMKNVTYTGSAIELNDGALKVQSALYKGMPLKEGEDYVVTGYSNNVNAGTATVHFEGINNYSGTAKKTFKIVAADVAGLKLKFVDTEGNIVDDVKYPYSKGGSKPAVHLEYNGKVLKAGTDYTLSYKGNTKLQMATVTVKGKKNFKGKLMDTFTVVKQDISNVTMNVPDVPYKDAANIYASKPVLTDVDGKKLAAKKDYDANSIKYTYATTCVVKQGGKDVNREEGDEIESTDVIPLGTILKATVKGIGNYDGEISGYYRIVTTSIAKAKVKVADQEYTGKAVQPGKDAITITVGGQTLGKDDYEIVGYSKNVAKGTATITLRGTGSYGGTVTAKFKIGQRTLIIDKILSLFGF